MRTKTTAASSTSIPALTLTCGSDYHISTLHTYVCTLYNSVLLLPIFGFQLSYDVHACTWHRHSLDVTAECLTQRLASRWYIPNEIYCAEVGYKDRNARASFWCRTVSCHSGTLCTSGMPFTGLNLRMSIAISLASLRGRHKHQQDTGQNQIHGKRK